MAQSAKQGASQKILETQLMKAAQALEDTMDEQLNRLDNLNEDDLEQIRQRRLKQMKEESLKRSEWLAAGHGVYSELSSERDFFDACKKSTSGFVCHFYRSSTLRCKIVDKHLSLLAPKHVECRMTKIDAEKSPFLSQRLNVVVIPTLILIRDGQVCDRIIGFDELGGHDEFSTAMLEWRLAVGQVINYQGDITVPPDSNKPKSSGLLVGLDSKRKEMKTIRDKHTGDDEDDDSD
ncbi:Thioredoxin domain-containing protein 9 like [Paragonimus heterotremus]|uniref:Thioredoxin domain-containing protein 9 n=1 Tax=Paragonimus heterotremus TaxID=100268 RepID=A0A8J4WE04_9TREM|nr:Thioredoxin domain-containing protein 9 like [Paragonimus heterotremus]